MKNTINWKLFLILWVASLITSLMVLPYALTLIASSGIVFTPVLLVAQVFQAGILFAIAIFVGLKFAPRLGFGLPILEAVFNKENPWLKLKGVLRLSIILGVLAGILIILFSLPFGSMSLNFLKAEMTVPAWKSLLASFYGGIAEEILLRLFLMTLLVWLIVKIKKTVDLKPNAMIIWSAIIISSVLFGLGHLPITSGLTAITPVVIIRAILLNGAGGVIFGWLYWQKGLESAMISHFTADIVLHVMVPLVASLLI